MSYPAHVLLSFGGGFDGQPDEEWSCGIRFTSTANGQNSALPSDNEIDSFRGLATTALKAWFSNPATLIGTAANLDWVKANAIGPDGRYARAPRPMTEVSDTSGGGSTPLHYPHQVSLAVTFETDTARGLAAKGRIYLPAPVAVMDIDGLLSDAQVQGIATQTGNLLTALNLPGVPGFYAAVVSNGGQSGDGVARRITRVSVDTRLDIQRRRGESVGGRNRLTATVGD